MSCLLYLGGELFVLFRGIICLFYLGGCVVCFILGGELFVLFREMS